ncbi:MAG: hypothetical protein ACI4JA_11365 [Oscillospiraceae bacterium]
MDILKTSVLTAGVIGIVSVLADFAVPGDGIKKQLKTIITLVLIMGLFTPFIGSDFRLSVNNIDELSEDSEFDNISEDFEDYYLEQSSAEIQKQIEKLLNEKNITFDKVRIYCSIDEYNSIEINKAVIYSAEASEQEVSDIVNTVAELIPNVEIEIKTEDNIEAE